MEWEHGESLLDLPVLLLLLAVVSLASSGIFCPFGGILIDP
jgi:hypothetical protein